MSCRLTSLARCLTLAGAIALAPSASAQAPETTDFETAAGRVRGLLEEAVEVRLMSEVPLGAFLSGGVDSSAVVAIMSRALARPVETFAVGFADAEFDESGHQLEMVRHLGTDHSTIRCERRQIGELFPALIAHTEAPILRTAPLPLMLLSKLVREQGYKVVLTGEGADEVFGGYDLFKEAKVRRFWARAPGSRLRPLLLRRLYGYLANSPVQLDAFAQSFFGLQPGSPWLDGLGFDINGAWLMGWAHVQTHMAGFDLLAMIQDHANEPAFDIPVPAGVYTMLIEDVDTTITYSLLFNVSAVPEPASAALLATAAIGFVAMRRTPRAAIRAGSDS